MNIDRLKRYREKLDLIEKRQSEIKEWKESALSDEKSKLATYKAFQEVAEAIMDVIAMILKDSRLLPKDDYLNIDAIEKNKILNKEICNALRDMNGLRNRIIHEYNGLSDKLALDSIEELLLNISLFCEEVEKWLKSQNSKN